MGGVAVVGTVALRGVNGVGTRLPARGSERAGQRESGSMRARYFGLSFRAREP